MCDVWQAIYNGWGLSQSGDADNDGCSNLIESIAGTNPRLAGDCLKVGNTVLSQSGIVFTFDAEAGKQYQVVEADQPNGSQPGNVWAPVAGALKTPTADNPGESISITRPAGVRKFYKLQVTDVDADNDGLSDWVERKTGTDPTSATSIANASGGAASDADTMRSLLSITATAAVPNGLERTVKTGTPTPMPAKIGLMRSFGTMPLTLPVSGGPGAPSPTRGAATVADFNVPTAVAIPQNGATSTPFLIDVLPVPDDVDEVPEYAKITFGLPNIPSAQGPSATVCVCDADPTNPINRTLYVAFLGREAGAASTASGYATALVEGDNDRASISVVFNNLSSLQNTCYIRVGPDLEVLPLPLGQVSGANWPIRAAQTEITDQRMLDALKNGELYVAITTENFQDKEIWGYFNKASGSAEFDSNNTNLAAPALGSTLWTNPTGDAMERDIWRFMNQATMGGTTALYTEIRAEVDAAIAGGGNYLLGLANWMDKQMNPSLTPSLNYQKLVMAADAEEFALRGNKPINYNNDPLQAGGTVGVTYVNGMPVANSGSPNTNDPGGNYPQNSPNRRREWWTIALQSKDQLRQRVAQALSEITVISERDAGTLLYHYGAANWWDMLASGAFGKYRDLLQQVTLNPMMGNYLTSLSNRATYDAGGGIIISPDENYAREIMQLFSIGLVLRHPDGSLILSPEGLPIATYDNNDISEMARVFTGFSHGARHGTVRAGINGGYGSVGTTDQRISSTIYSNGSGNNVWFGRQDGHWYWQAPWTTPMAVIGRQGATVYHDFNAKTLFNGKHQQTDLGLQTVNNVAPFVPATDAEAHSLALADVVNAHDALAGRASDATYPDYDPNPNPARPGHTNTPINISRWMIQRLVTSNPSAGYIYRVQKAYRDSNGTLGNVVKAIFLDYEARSLQLADSAVAHGKIKEPMIHFAHVLRQFKAFSGAPVSVLSSMETGFSETDSPIAKYPGSELAKFGSYNLSPPSKPTAWPDGPFRFRIDSLRTNLGQSPLDAPTVFNWFYPDFTVPGKLSQAGLFAPEMQTITEAAEVSKINHLYNYTWMTLAPMSATPGVSGADFIFRNGSATPAVRFSTNGGSSLMGWPATILLDSTNWNTGITLTMVGVNNQHISQMAYSGVRYAVTGSAPGYNGVAVAPTPVSFIENEPKNEQLVVSETSSGTWVHEGGVTDSISIRLSAPLPPGASVDVSFATANGEVGITPPTLTFTEANWNTNQSITVTATDDTDVEDIGTGDDRIVITTSSSTSANYHGIVTGDVPVNVNDNDGGIGIIIAESGGFTDVAETSASVISPLSAGMDSYTIALASAPTANVVVTCTGNGLQVNQTATSTFGSPYTRTFTTANWNVPQTVVVRGNNDTTAEGPHWGRVVHTVATAGGYTASMPIPLVTTHIADDDDSIILRHTGTETRVMEGDFTDTITVALRTNPNAPVSVTLSSPQLSFNPATIVFQPTGGTGILWNSPQTVTVTANDDFINEGIQRGFTSDAPPVPASATATLTSGAVSVVTVTNQGHGYVGIPSVSFTAAPTGGTTAAGYPLMTPYGKIASIAITIPGSGYVSTPAITITAPQIPPVVINAYSQSTGTNYNGSAAPVLPVTVIDNDDSRIVINESGGSTLVNEDGTVDTYTIALGRRPDTGSTSTVSLVPSTTGIQVSPVGPFTFNDTNWNTPVTVTVTTTNDVTAEPRATATITHHITSTDPTYDRVNSPVVVVTVDDNDPALAITQSNIYTQVKEGGTVGAGGTPNVGDTFTVGMNGRNPTANLTVTLVPNSQITVSPAVLTFSSTVTAAQTVTVTAVNDTDVENTVHGGVIGFNLASTDSYFNGAFVPPVLVQVTDDDSPGVSIVESSGTTQTTEGSTTTDSFTVVLTKQPSANVDVTLDGGSQSRLSKTSTVAALTTATLNFTTANWSTPQTVWTLPVDDTAAELRHLAPITLALTPASAAEYAALTIPGVTHIITDNDNNVASNVVRMTETSGFTSVTESTLTDTFTVVLSQQPTSNVTITFTGDSQVTVSPSTLTFVPGTTGAGTFNSAQTVTVRAIDDSIVEPILHWGQVTATVASADTFFDGKAVTPVNATVYDNDGPRVNVIQSGGNTLTNENGVTDTYTLSLSHQPSSDVIVTITSDAQVSTDLATVTFTAADWAPKTITITAVNDSVIEAVTHNGLITHSIASADPLYQNLSAATLTVPIWDNDVASIDVTHIGGTNTVITEGGAPDSILIKLNTQPPPGTNATITLYPPMVFIPPPLIGKTSGYFANDQGTSNQRDNIVIDYTESILQYRSTFYTTLAGLYAPAPIPATLATTVTTADGIKLQKAHWAASKAVVDQMDLWFNGGSMKAKNPVLVEPHATAPIPLPPINAKPSLKPSTPTVAAPTSPPPNATPLKAPTTPKPHPPTLSTPMCETASDGAAIS